MRMRILHIMVRPLCTIRAPPTVDIRFAMSAIHMIMTGLSILSLLLLVAAADTSSTSTTECNLQVVECPYTQKELHIENIMIPGCCKWPCGLHKNTTASIILEFHTGKSFQEASYKLK